MANGFLSVAIKAQVSAIFPGTSVRFLALLWCGFLATLDERPWGEEAAETRKTLALIQLIPD